MSLREANEIERRLRPLYLRQWRLNLARQMERRVYVVEEIEAEYSRNQRLIALLEDLRDL